MTNKYIHPSIHTYKDANGVVLVSLLLTFKHCSSVSIINFEQVTPLTFQKHLENLKTWFCKRGYPEKVADAQIKSFLKKFR